MTAPSAFGVPSAVFAIIALSIVALVFSHRLLRRVRGVVAHSLYRLGLGAGRDGHLGTLRSARNVREFFEALPWVTCRAGGVKPVTLFLLEGHRFVPGHSTRAEVESVPVEPDEPLAYMMSRSGWVHDLRGRADDLENAQILAVNSTQVEECRAMCAIPLRTRGALYGFLLCGGSQGQDRLNMTSRAWLEALGRLYSAYLSRFEAYALLESAGASIPATRVTEAPELVPVGSVTPVLRPAAYLESGSTVGHSTDVSVIEPRMAGYRGGFETVD